MVFLFEYLVSQNPNQYLNLAIMSYSRRFTCLGFSLFPALLLFWLSASAQRKPEVPVDHRFDALDQLFKQEQKDLGLFAALAMIISGCGIAASLALSVRQRTNELGVRMALGASRGSIVWMVVRQGLTLAAAGAAIGTAGALALTRLLEAVLYSTSPPDAATFIAVSALFLAIALIACFIPARQVTAIDPVIALRQE